MSSIKTLNGINISVVDECDVRVEEANVTYRLYRIEFIEVTKYAISASLKNENEICFLSSDVSESREFFRIICKNSVTPCTLSYVVEDFCK